MDSPLIRTFPLALLLGALATGWTEEPPGRPPAPPEAQPTAVPEPAPTRSGIQRRKITSGVPDEARVRELTESLSIDPRGLGRPIGDRTAWAAFLTNQDLTAAAERELTAANPELPDDLYLIFSRTGSRKEYEKVYSHRTKRLAQFVLAECVENRGRFLPAIEKQLDSILSEKTWTLPAHDRKLEAFYQTKLNVDLGAAMRAWNLGTVDYLLGDKLASDSRTRIRAEIERRIFRPYRETVEGKGTSAYWIRSDHNWNAVCHAGVIGAALALLPERSERAWYLAAMEMYLGNYLAGFSEDGYCSEGMGYWNYGFGHYVLLAQAAGSCTQWQVDLYAPEIIPKIVSYPNRLQIAPTVYPAFADGDPSVKPSHWIFHVAGQRIPVVLPAGMAASGRLSGLSVHSLAAMLYETMAVAFPEPSTSRKPPEAQQGLPLRDLFSEAGIAIHRPEAAETGRGLAIAIKGGHNSEHHNHNDVGSYVVALNSKTLLVDPGMEVYTSRTFSPQRYDSKVINSYGHPVPVVAGKLQTTGRDAYGVLAQTAATAAEDRLAIDLTQAYVKQVPALKKLNRTMRYVRSPEAMIEIADEAEFSSEQAFASALITFGNCERLAPDRILIYEGSEAVQVSIQTEGVDFELIEELLDEKLPSGRKPRRIGIWLSAPIVKGRIGIRIQPATPPAAASAVLEKRFGEPHGPRWKEAIRIEAQDFAAEKGGQIEVTEKLAATNGTAARMWNNQGHELAWKIRVEKPGVYGLLLRYCNGGGADAVRELKVDEMPVAALEKGASFPITGGWSSNEDNWREVWLAAGKRVYTVKLDAGAHTIALQNVDGPLTLDWIALVPMAK